MNDIGKNENHFMSGKGMKCLEIQQKENIEMHTNSNTSISYYLFVIREQYKFKWEVITQIWLLAIHICLFVKSIHEVINTERC